MDEAGILRSWGKRTHVAVAKIPFNEEIHFLIGQASPQINGMERATGGIIQLRFKEFKAEWIKEVRELPKESINRWVNEWSNLEKSLPKK